jgi:hypothetical protein
MSAAQNSDARWDHPCARRAIVTTWFGASLPPNVADGDHLDRHCDQAVRDGEQPDRVGEPPKPATRGLICFDAHEGEAWKAGRYEQRINMMQQYKQAGRQLRPVVDATDAPSWG